MKITRVGFVAAALAVATPGVAGAKTCVDVYYHCLNDTWDTSGITRILADIECAAKYVACVRNQF